MDGIDASQNSIVLSYLAGPTSFRGKYIWGLGFKVWGLVFGHDRSTGLLLRNLN